MRQELAAAREVAARASSTWDKFRKERDFHRMHHKRVAQEKNRLIADVKRLKVRACQLVLMLLLRKGPELAFAAVGSYACSTTVLAPAGRLCCACGK